MSDDIIISKPRFGIAASLYGRRPSEIIKTAEQYAPRKEWETSPRTVIVVAANDVYTEYMSLWSRATGGEHLASEISRPVVPPSQLRINRLTEIQAAFGLPIQTLADVLSISRAQIYKWLDLANDVTLQDESQQRMVLIERLAREWRKLSNAPLNIVAREPVTGATTVLNLLKSLIIDEATVMAAFQELAGHLANKGKTESQRLAEAGYVRRPSYRALPSDE